MPHLADFQPEGFKRPSNCFFYHLRDPGWVRKGCVSHNGISDVADGANISIVAE
jgi:hypothetical protein